MIRQSLLKFIYRGRIQVMSNSWVALLPSFTKKFISECVIKQDDSCLLIIFDIGANNIGTINHI